MRDGQTVYQATKRGCETLYDGARQLAKRLGVDRTCIYETANISRKPFRIKGYIIEECGTYEAHYDVYEGEELIISDTLEECAKKINASLGGMRKAMYAKRLLFGKYKIVKNEEV